MIKNHSKTRIRELKQLWTIGKHYFYLSTRIKNKLNSNHLNLKPTDIAKLCNNQPKIKGELRQIILLTAHLASSAVRLTTIDEIQGGNSSKRLKIYKKLKRKDKLTIKDLHSNSDEIIHFLLRHNVAHAEPTSTQKQQYNEMKKYLDNLTIQQIYTHMETVMLSLEKDLPKYLF